MSDRLVTVTRTYSIADGVPAKGTVSLSPAIAAGNSEPLKRLVTKHSVVAALDAEGTATLHVLASDDPDWNVDGGVLYELREYIVGGRGRAHLVFIPGPGPVDLFDLEPIEVDVQTVAPYPVPGPVGPANSLAIGTVSTLPPDAPATAMISGTPPAQVLDLGIPKGETGNPTDAALGDLTDVDTSLDATGMVITRMANGTYRGQHVHVSLNQLTDVTAPAATPPNSLLGTVGEGLTPGQAEWEPLHLDYVQATVLGPLPSTVADLGQRVTELEHTGEIVPPDLDLTVDLYSGSFTRIIGCAPITASPSKRIRLSLATTPGPNGAVFASLADISGTGAVWADFNGTIGKVVDSSGQGLNGAALKEAIRRGQIVTVHRGSDGTHPTLVVEKVEDPADAGSSLTLDALKNVSAPANTPAGMLLGTTGTDAWGPVANPVLAHVAAADPHPNTYPGKMRTSRPNATDRLVEVWDGAAWVPTHYDSGWRDVSGILHTANGWALKPGASLRLRRYGTSVEFHVAGNNGGLDGSLSTSELATLPMPAGFSVAYPYGWTALGTIGFDALLFAVSQDASGGLNVWGKPGATSGSVRWFTNDPIPTSLPGTLITTAP